MRGGDEYKLLLYIQCEAWLVGLVVTFLMIGEYGVDTSGWYGVGGD